MTNLDSILKSRDITLSIKVCLVKAIREGNGTPLQYSCLENPMDGGAWWAAVYGVAQSWTLLKWLSSQGCGFSSGHVWMWELDCKESWASKNWCFWTVWCWRRLLRVSWTARRSNQSILKEISPEYSLEGLMLKLKLQYFGHLMRRTNLKRPWCWERLKAGERDDRGWDGWMASPTQQTWVWVRYGSCGWTEKPAVLRSMGLQRVRHGWVTKLNWTEQASVWSSLNESPNCAISYISLEICLTFQSLSFLIFRTG